MASGPLGLRGCRVCSRGPSGGTGGAPGVMGGRGQQGPKEGEAGEAWLPEMARGVGALGAAPGQEWPVLTRAACPQARRSLRGKRLGNCWGAEAPGIWRPDGSGRGARGGEK